MEKHWLWIGAGVLGLLFLGNEVKTMTGTARGFRNNNPGNIRFSTKNNWQGQIGKDKDGFVIFDTPLNGLRASAKLIKNKLNKGQSTIAALIESWAPPNENNTPAYVAAVAKALGVSSSASLNATHIPGLLNAIIKHENGSNPYPVTLIQQAIAAIG